MNKQKINALIPTAYKVLEEQGIAKDGTIAQGYPGQIAAFGGAIALGSLLAAVCHFSKKSEDIHDRKNEDVRRELLLPAIFALLDKDEKDGYDNLQDYVLKKTKDESEDEAKEHVMDSAIALKLAMNLYPKKKSGGTSSQEGGESHGKDREQ